MNATDAARVASEKTKERENLKQENLKAFQERTSERVITAAKIRTRPTNPSSKEIRINKKHEENQHNLVVRPSIETLHETAAEIFTDASNKSFACYENNENDDDVASCLSDDGVQSDTSDGLELPEGCELAKLVTSQQEEYCEAWGYLQTFLVKKNNHGNEGDNE
mmetsp:Transcript_17366/g.20445  ORF Transcript_17366/g.20445 Transcript_17366/m.20445 type:complete len:165 (-) Transcript_17366:238-732(-)